MAITTQVSIITLNVNAPTKRQIGRMDTKTRPACMLSTRNPLQFQGQILTESGRCKNIFHANGNHKKAGVAIFI